MLMYQVSLPTESSCWSSTILDHLSPSWPFNLSTITSVSVPLMCYRHQGPSQGCGLISHISRTCNLNQNLSPVSQRLKLSQNSVCLPMSVTWGKMDLFLMWSFSIGKKDLLWDTVLRNKLYVHFQIRNSRTPVSRVTWFWIKNENLI